MNNGSLRCWGYNTSGQLGDGTLDARAAAMPVPSLSAGVTSISAGRDYTCAVTTGGGVKCWGANTFGELGDGTRVARTTPADVVGLTSGVVALGSAEGRTCALTAQGSVKCWGSNQQGALGDGTNVAFRTTPVDVLGLSSGVATLSVGNFHACVLMTTGTMRCFGYNAFGQLGDGSLTNRAPAVDVQGLGGNPSSIEAMGYHTCAVVAGVGKCWGQSTFGQIGDPLAGSNPRLPVTVVLLGSAVSMFAGADYSTCALTAGTVKCWGFNMYGLVGNGTLVDAGLPRDVVDLPSPGLGYYGGANNVCAVAASPGARCWGWGGAVDGTLVIRSSPVAVVGLEGEN